MEKEIGKKEDTLNPGAACLFQLPIPEPVQKVLDTLNANGEEAWLVGGCVRDSLRGIAPNDYDITTTLRPEQVMARFEHVVPTGIEHGTVTVLQDGCPIEVTTMRKEGTYRDHRHPDAVSFTRDIREDLARRDFTINAMAYHPEKGLIDPYGGIDDLKKRQIRAVGDPKGRFEEDALRMFRAWAFAARLQGTIEENTLKAIHEKSALSSTLAAERVAPLIETVLRDDPRLIEPMADLLRPWIPEVEVMASTPQCTPYHYGGVLTHTIDVLRYLPHRDPVLLWAALLHDCGKPDVRFHDENDRDHFHGHEQASARHAKVILSRLKLPKQLQKDVVKLIPDHDTFFRPAYQSLYRILVQKGYTKALFEKLMDLQEADIEAHATKDRRERLDLFRAYFEQEKDRHPFTIAELKINGDDVIAQTHLQGSQRRDVLLEVLHQVILHPEWETREDQLRLLRSAEKVVRNAQKSK